MIKAVVFDMDDTLYPEYEFVMGGFGTVADYVEKRHGLKDVFPLMEKLFHQNKKAVYENLYSELGLPFAVGEKEEMIQLFRKFEPQTLQFYDDVPPVLQRLKSVGIPIGLITDGRAESQRAKIRALGLDGLFDSIVVTDELGDEREDFGKPHALPFLLTAKQLNVSCDEMLYVGDNAAKDFAVRIELPVVTVEILRPNKIHQKPYKNGVLPLYQIDTMDKIFSIMEKEDA